ncbi:ABC transporter ATP-binding protein [Martelella sp. HB161492]|uniref:ABC transporter ATP-binding protein n=1 Tax=Martelella sp. HB161492 TaxID=2720726 RepID=UPI001AEDB826|nr:ABC transporter ATP-binding protein [Martelella sp. HB161492]
MKTLAIDHVALSYGRERLVLSDISLVADKERITVILGPSGCGKTSLLRIAAGLIAPDSGTVMIDGRPPVPGRDTALLFQDARLLPWRTARQNLMVVPGAGRADTADALLARVGLEGAGDLYPEELSGGMQQRLALARALATPAPLLLMDEPFASLDALAREEMQSELLRVLDAEKERRILFVTHSVDEALILAEQIVVMRPAPGHIDQIVRPALGPAGTMRRDHPMFADIRRDLADALHRS